MGRDYVSGAKPIYRNTEEAYPSMISIVSAKICARIYIEDIEYIEQEGRQLHIVTADTDYIVYENIEAIVDVVLSNESFYRSLKTMLINFNRVSKMEDDYIYFESGRCVTLGRNSVCKTRKAFRQHIIRYQISPEVIKEIKVAEKL